MCYTCAGTEDLKLHLDNYVLNTVHQHHTEIDTDMKK